MDVSLRELRCFIAAVEAGTLTGAATELHVSQASVSRGIAGLERTLGQRVLRRGRHGCEPTAFGESMLPDARRILAQVDRLGVLAKAHHGQLNLGYSWAALGRHTTPLLRGWPKSHPETELRLIRHLSPTSGLAEGRCDAAIMRTPPDPARFSSAVVGLERRVAAFSADDPLWAKRRSLRMHEFAGRTILTDPRTGTTSRALWDGGPQPDHFVDIHDIDEWLNSLAAGAGVGVTSEASVVHYARTGIVYRPITAAPRIAVRIAWWRDDPPTGIEALIETVTRLYSGA